MIYGVAEKLIFGIEPPQEHIAHQQAIKTNKTPLDFLFLSGTRGRNADDEK